MLVRRSGISVSRMGIISKLLCEDIKLGEGSTRVNMQKRLIMALRFIAVVIGNTLIIMVMSSIPMSPWYIHHFPASNTATVSLCWSMTTALWNGWICGFLLGKASLIYALIPPTLYLGGVALTLWSPIFLLIDLQYPMMLALSELGAIIAVHNAR